jgi:hypothetical protein
MYEKEFFLIGKRLEQTVAMFLLKVAETAGRDLPAFFHPHCPKTLGNKILLQKSTLYKT